MNALAITFLLLANILLCQDQWTPAQLKEKFDQSTSKQVLDPNLFITLNSVQKIKKQFDKIPEFTTYLVIINNINDSYYSYFLFQKDIDKFAEEYIWAIFPEKSDRDKTLLMIYSIKDKVYKLRTGEETRKRLSDRACVYIADSIKELLRSGKYDEAFVALGESLVYYYISGVPWWPYIFIVFIGILFFVGICCQKPPNLDKEEEISKRMKTWKELKDSGKTFKAFTEENCVICLQKLTPADTIDETKIEKQQEKTQDNEEKVILPESKAALIRDENETSVFLQCGHNFHRDCIKEWLANNDKCPICRTEVLDSSQSLLKYDNWFLDVQQNHYRSHFSYRQVNNMYFNNEFSWTKYSNNAGGINYRYDSRSGGTTGGW